MPEATPSRKTHTKVDPVAGVGRQLHPEAQPGDGESRTNWASEVTGDEADLAEEVGDRRHRRRAEPLEGAVVALDRDAMAIDWKLVSRTPAATMPGRKNRAALTPDCVLVAERVAEDRGEHARA